MINCNYNLIWFEKGLDYALKSWTSTFNRLGKPNPYSRIEKILIGIIAELAVENYLKASEISYDEKGKTRWYEKDRYDIGIGNYAVDVKANFLDLNSNYIQKIFSENNIRHQWLNKCISLVPLDQFNPAKKDRKINQRKKVYVFPFIEGCFNENIINSSNLIHAFWDYRWLKRAEFKTYGPLGKLKISYFGSLDENQKIILYGTSKPKQFIKETIFLNNNRIITKNKYHQVFSIRLIGKPDGSLKIESSEQKLSEVILPDCNFELEKNLITSKYVPKENNWQNLSLNSVKIYLCGWMKDEDLRILGRSYKRFDKSIPQYSEIKIDNWGVEVSELNHMKSIKSLQ
tara:strand:- start:94 stop:1125 length:1032 start_codon:yes stop_codon:yes gene_type:complete